ncbi:translation initiation factor IF-2 subunit gamma [Candidatus Woesearchaeota archaeon]|nr:MAG: translation initiation factor IF-2 subunit gamma [Candidatus Woesearchaeota archaeon]
MKRLVQPEINIGLVGHVDHGKTTLVKALSGIWTDTHSEELKRGITIRLGYADCIFYKCPKCGRYGVKKICKCGAETEPLRKVSFVDAPGHESLMATMLSGATIMDGALLIIAANETCPQPQTREHLMALQIIGIKNIVVVQNKIDTVSEDEALKNYEEIKQFLSGTPYKNAPVIPVSAQQEVNIDVLVEAIEKNIPTPKRDPTKDPIMLVARSFDVNKPGTLPENLVGSVLGGSIKQGKLRVGQEIELRPGIETESHGKKEWNPITTKIVEIRTGGEKVEEAGPGGNLGIQTLLDPSLAKGDSLAGNIVGLPGRMPPVWNKLTLNVHLLERVVGTKEELKVESLKMNEPLMLNVNVAATVGIVTKILEQGSKIECVLRIPVCAEIGSKVTISRRIGNRFRLIGYGVIL